MREIFEKMEKAKIFRDRDFLRPDYIPERLPHREEEIKRLGSILAQVLKGSKPNNVFIYGLTGTGKTAVTRYVLKRLEEHLRSKMLYHGFKYVYINCRRRDTPYRVLADIAEGLGVRIPFTGLSTAEVYRRIVNKLDLWRGILLVVLDEVDFLVRRHGDDVLYKLTRINEELSYASVSLIGITNDIKFVENLDPRVKSSLGEEELVFPPYNAEQLRDILRERAEKAFYPRVLDEGVIDLCAAYAAREHGDARRALDLLRVAGEVAERVGDTRVTIEHVKRARIELERDRVSEIVRTLPLHSKLVLASILKLSTNKGLTTTGEVYNLYRFVCRRLGLEEVTQRRVSDIINELDMLGIINARVVSRGRYGKTRIIKLGVDKETLTEVLKEDIHVSEILR